MELPETINSIEEYDRIEMIVNDLLDKGEEHLTPVEEKLLDSLSDLMEDYERRTLEPIPDATPIELLEILMRHHDLEPQDLADIFGTSSAVSDVLNGKRMIAEDEAKQLSKRFSMLPDVFVQTNQP